MFCCSIMETQSGIEELEERLCSLTPRSELVARMALRLHVYDVFDKKSYFARIAQLINTLDLTAEALSVVRADAHKVAARLTAANVTSKALVNEFAP